jgi:outer membrane lipoprotein carrier protein
MQYLPALLALCLAAASLAGEKGPVRANEAAAHLLQRLDAMRTLQARFVQTIVSEAGDALETVKGRLVIVRPGKFRWEVTEPYSQFVVADGTYLWQYDPDLEQATVRNQDSAMENTPAAILSGDASGLLEHYDILAREEGAAQIFELQSRDGEGFGRISLRFDGGVLSGLVLLDSLGQTTKVALEQVMVNEPVSDSEFHLSLPDDVDIVDSRDHGG